VEQLHASGTIAIDTATTVDKTTAQTLTNKTLTSPKINEDVAVTSTATELNLLDGSTAGTIANSKAVIYSAAGQVNGTTLAIAGTAITSTAS
jgi:poly-gamma-glutamate capsule biosynthesis protein CapA/YwtB (metallophosphatase superfamily)